MSSLQSIKQSIWQLCNRNPVTVQVAADKCKVRLPITQVHEAEKLLKHLTKPRRKTARLPAEIAARYIAAHEAWFRSEYPAAHKDGHYILPVVPDTSKSNGLQTFIINYLGWTGNRATRINVQGRMIGDKYIPSATKKGSADVSSTIRGASVMWEIKVGRDKPSPAQLKEQARERKAGGEYFFTHSAEEFFEQLDSISVQSSIFDNASFTQR